jgi:hypothetical protein
MIAVILFLVLISLLSYFPSIATACAQPSAHSQRSIIPISPSFLSYENSALGIRIEYPAYWKPTSYQNHVSFSPTTKGGEPIYTVYLDIYVNRYTPNNNHTLTYYNNNTLSKGTRFVLTPIIAAGYPAIKNEFTDFRFNRGPSPPPFPAPVNLTHIYILKGETLYLIEYQTSNTGPYLLATIKKMIDSFQITGNARAEP